MSEITQIFVGLFTVFIAVVIKKSLIFPRARKIQAIMLLGKFHRLIANVEGKKVNTITWDLEDKPIGEKKRLNIYFALWPFFTIYKYPFSYTKIKKVGEEEPGDVVVWKNEVTKECVVARRGISDHLEYRVEYPTITSSLDTVELVAVNTFTNHVLEVVNGVKMLFGISNWLNLAMESINGALRGVVASKNIEELNKLSSEDQPEFNAAMANANNDRPNHPGLLTFGVKVVKSIFKDFEGADENAKRFIESFSKVKVAENDGKAALAKQEGETKAFLLKTNAEIEQEKKKRIQTGVAKADQGGNIVELVPEANVKVTAENLGKLSDLKGTLVIGGETANMLNLR